MDVRDLENKTIFSTKTKVKYRDDIYFFKYVKETDKIVNTV